MTCRFFSISSPGSARVAVTIEVVSGKGPASRAKGFSWLLLALTLIPLCVAAMAQSGSPQLIADSAMLDAEEIPQRAAFHAVAFPDNADFPPRPAAEPAVRIGTPGEIQPTLHVTPTLAEPYIALQPLPKPKFQTRAALRQEFEYLMVEHSFRIMQDPSLRYQLLHQPFLQELLQVFQGV